MRVFTPLPLPYSTRRTSLPRLSAMLAACSFIKAISQRQVILRLLADLLEQGRTALVVEQPGGQPLGFQREPATGHRQNFVQWRSTIIVVAGSARLYAAHRSCPSRSPANCQRA